MLLAAGLARKAVLALSEQLGTNPTLQNNLLEFQKLHRAQQQLLQTSLTAQQTAKSYDIPKDIYKIYSFDNFGDLAKFATLAVREVLVLQIGCSARSMSAIGFESALVHALGRQPGFHLPRSAVCSLGRNRKVFHSAEPELFSSALEQDERDDFRGIYIEHLGCTQSTSGESFLSALSDH